MSLPDRLVRRPTIRRRNAVSFLTVRAWRTATRAEDLAAFKAEKKAKTIDVLEAAAADIAGELVAMAAPVPGWSVCCIACGHSRDPECWGKHLARAVGAVIGLPFVEAFEDRLVAGVSHPKENINLPPLAWRTVPQGPVLLIDDLCTSGFHLEEALTLLRGRGLPAIGAAWIGGTVEDADPTAKLPAWARDLPGYVAQLESAA
ncbi:MAG: phosphoribosyltransferase [Alphaproteobacteria bacterium]